MAALDAIAPKPRDLLDAALGAEVRDRLAHDRRAQHLELGVEVRGRVAHVEGAVADGAERDLVRRLVRGCADVLAVWDRLTVPGADELVIVDLGCGPSKQVPEAIGVDVVAHPGVDVVADADEGLPFADGSVDCLFAVHVLEHVRDLLAVMRELHRVLRPDGVLHVLSPHRDDVNAWADPTHVRYFDPELFKYFALDKPGVAPWRPLGVATDGVDVLADLQPLGPDAPLPDAAELARWFR